MKQLLVCFVAVLAMVSCKETEQKEEEMPAVNDEQLQEVAYMEYGGSMSDVEAISAMEMGEKYASMKTGDTTMVKVKGVIADVCSKKGCWVKVPVGQDTTFVRFKDYSFFLPKNGKGKEVVLEGMAFKSVTPVDELKHYAMDAGKSQEEIDAITEEEVTLKFTATAAKVEEFENPDVFEPAPETTETEE